jgi:CDP-diacylglycerol--glycerol-3-phosphate 3-phosphatidyltransferase
MNLATMVTLSRIAIAPVFAYVFITGFTGGRTHLWVWVCGALALLIEITDMVDGRIARARNEVTDFGKVFDPVADSLSRQTIFISFMVAGIIPWWLYLVFFYRDAFLQLLRIICASGGLVLAARPSGKLKAVLQGMGTFGVLIVVALQLYHVSWMPAKFWGFHPGFWVMVIPAVFTLFSVADYVAPNVGMIKRMMEAKRNNT